MGVLFEKEGHVAIVTLNRPEALNALDPESWDELQQIWHDIKTDPEIRVTVLTGAGEKSFCTGSDMKKTMPPKENYASTYFESESLIASMEMWKPIICAINGYAIGGGLEMALACDIRIASSKASFGLSEVKVGSLPGLGGTQRLLRAISSAIAMKMLLTAERISAEEAYRIGLISDVVEPDQLLDYAKQMANKIANNAPLSVKAAKQAVVIGADLPLRQGMAYENLLWGILRDTEDRIEGRVAFAEKRPPQYKGR
ncbi:enoyl-CoA hydratase/isomerase family protein [Desulfoscipio gibsoniae]|uniref:short-chain-enoyl-CoA hydratase n=1 Tax=Desulfoscipio gibsoniae DSM 7213 TaxID=767817 RepID=R4KKR2_9FIRM|nr:enoyl-CoA hydratase-related protein [Desulfoscipio gibsoniae]AGL00226.1 enoyl-CoA hydratase/carnithine racemase [Desulfoscipio gibsoniae DSM 7213]